MTVVSEDNGKNKGQWTVPEDYDPNKKYPSFQGTGGGGGAALLLEDRASTHGDYQKKSEFIQELKAMMRETPNWRDAGIEDYRQESLDLIATKIGRILFGNPDEADHWRDIAGYATLGCGWEP